MFHIGEIPTDKFTDQSAKPDDHYTNRRLIQENLYALCLNAILVESSDEGESSAGP